MPQQKPEFELQPEPQALVPDLACKAKTKIESELKPECVRRARAEA